MANINNYIIRYIQKVTSGITGSGPIGNTGPMGNTGSGGDGVVVIYFN